MGRLPSIRSSLAIAALLALAACAGQGPATLPPAGGNGRPSGAEIAAALNAELAHCYFVPPNILRCPP